MLPGLPARALLLSLLSCVRHCGQCPTPIIHSAYLSTPAPKGPHAVPVAAQFFHSAYEVHPSTLAHLGLRHPPQQLPRIGVHGRPQSFAFSFTDGVELAPRVLLS